MCGDGNFSVRRSNRIFKPPDRLGCVPFFGSNIYHLILTGLARKKQTKPGLLSREATKSDEDYDPNNGK